MTSANAMLDSITHIIAVASGKGGVGKSTTAANLALALAQQGAKVGILDADIYGPSLGMLFGIAEGTKPAVKDEKYFIPIEAHGVKVMTMAFLASEQTPMAWRGPMASGALLQLLTQTAWGELDYLVIDMPPGTGDIQLTLAQKAHISAAVIVTTPQDLALIDAKKAISLFEKVNVPVLGVIENMAVHICSNCGHVEHLFGEGGGARLAAQYQVTLLGSLPLALAIREQADSGKPTVAAEPTGEVAKIYQNIALHIVQQLAQLQANAPAFPIIETTDE